MVLLAAIGCRGNLTGELALEVDVAAARVCETPNSNFLMDWLIASNETCAEGASLTFDEACDALLEWGEADCGHTGSGMAPLLPNVAEIVSGSGYLAPSGRINSGWTWDCEGVNGRELSIRTTGRLREDDVVYRFEEPDLLEGTVILELCPE